MAVPTYPPVIIIGMHRSGTSLLTRMLNCLGLFIGARRDVNDEAIFFQRENDWLLKQAGGTWDNPQSVGALLAHCDRRSACLRHLERRLRSPYLWRYLGMSQFLRYRSAFSLDFAWGWKDPCNTYTLPLWLQLYPDARVVHIRRHGVDVAQSLVKRETGKEAADSIASTLGSGLRRLNGYPSRVAPSLCCETLEGAFGLWEEYSAEARRHVGKLGPRAFELSYEQLLEAPQDQLRALCHFCGLHVEESAIGEVASMASRSRARAFRRDDVLAAFAQRVRSRLAIYDY
ncbi:MAG TPA: sulfotransferase [Hyphomicrobiaceae bacterium]